MNHIPDLLETPSGTTSTPSVPAAGRVREVCLYTSASVWWEFRLKIVWGVLVFRF